MVKGMMMMTDALRDASSQSMDFFATIRSNANTQLQNQQLALSLLNSTETVLKRNQYSFTAEHYFEALWPLLDDEDKEKKMPKGMAENFNIAVAYLVSFVAPTLSPEYIKSHYPEIYEKFISTFQRFFSAAPIVRSLIPVIGVVLETFLVGWGDEEQGWKSSLNEFLAMIESLSLDHRPKVRKLAQEVLSKLFVKASMENSPLCPHILGYIVGNSLKQATRKEASDAFHGVAFLKLASEGANMRIFLYYLQEGAELENQLLRCASLGNTHLSASIYDFISQVLAEANKSDEATSNPHNLNNLILKLTALKPDEDIEAIVVPWLASFTQVLLYVSRTSNISTALLKEHFTLIMSFWQILVHEKSLNALVNELRRLYCFVSDDCKDLSLFVVDYLRLCLKKESIALHAARSIGDLCRESGLKTIPVQLLQEMGKILEKSSSSKALIAELEQTIGSFVSQYGAKAILEALPVRVERGQKIMSNLWLLSILKEFTSHSSLSVFIEKLLPQADECWQGITAGTSSQDTIQLFQRIYQQIWLCFPAFLTFPTDFAQSFPAFAPTLGSLLNNSPSIRTIVVTALASFINRQRSIEDNLDDDSASASENLKVMTSLASNFLPILLNIFASTSPDRRDYLLKGIQTFVSLLDEATIEQRYLNRVLKRLSQAKGQEQLSLLELITPFASNITDTSVQQNIFSLLLGFIKLDCVNSEALVIQKRIYRVLGDLLSREDLIPEEQKANFFDLLESTLLPPQSIMLEPHQGKKKSSPTEKMRLRMILKLIKFLPSSHLHWAVLLIPEITRAIKDSNNQTRLYAFELLLALARRCSREEGIQEAVICASKAHGLISMDIPCSLSTFVSIIVSLGLGGTESSSPSPNRLSATIMMLARLIFEFKESCLGRDELGDLFSDLINMLQSPSREVVKSILGFMKVAIGGSISSDIIENYLPDLVSSLFKWSQEHHQHFRVRVRHMVERLVRKFGFERINQLTPEAHRKLLTNIRKRRERAKRHKQASQHEEEEGSEKQVNGREFSSRASGVTLLSRATTARTALSKGMTSSIKANARFESALNESESDLGDDDDEEEEFLFSNDSVLKDLKDLDDDDEIEAVLQKKLSLAQVQNKRIKRTRHQPENYPADNDDLDDDFDAIGFTDDGRMQIADLELNEDQDDEDDDGEEKRPNKKPNKVIKNRNKRKARA